MCSVSEWNWVCDLPILLAGYEIGPAPKAIAELVRNNHSATVLYFPADPGSACRVPGVGDLHSLNTNRAIVMSYHDDTSQRTMAEVRATNRKTIVVCRETVIL